MSNTRQTFGWAIVRASRTSLVNLVRRVPAQRPEVGQQLERHRLAQPEVVGAVDLAHGSASEKTDDAETCGEHMPRREPGLADRQGRSERVLQRRTLVGFCRRLGLARGQRDPAEGAPER